MCGGVSIAESAHCGFGANAAFPPVLALSAGHRVLKSSCGAADRSPPAHGRRHRGRLYRHGHRRGRAVAGAAGRLRRWGRRRRRRLGCCPARCTLAGGPSSGVECRRCRRRLPARCTAGARPVVDRALAVQPRRGFRASVDLPGRPTVRRALARAAADIRSGGAWAPGHPLGIGAGRRTGHRTGTSGVAPGRGLPVHDRAGREHGSRSRVFGGPLSCGNRTYSTADPLVAAGRDRDRVGHGSGDLARRRAE